MTQNRRYARLDFDEPIEILIEGNSQPGRTVNISQGGVLVETTSAPPFGSSLVLKISLPGVPKTCEISCIVRWRKDDVCVGLQFENLRAIEVWALNKLMKSLQGA